MWRRRASRRPILSYVEKMTDSPARMNLNLRVGWLKHGDRLPLPAVQ
jgi:hypothetical protein